MAWLRKYSTSARYALNPDNATALNLVPILDQPTTLHAAQDLSAFDHEEEVRRNLGGDIKHEVTEGESFSLLTPKTKIEVKMEEMGLGGSANWDILKSVKREAVPVVEEETFSQSAKSLRDQQGLDAMKNQALAYITKCLQPFRLLCALVSGHVVDLSELSVAVLVGIEESLGHQTTTFTALDRLHASVVAADTAFNADPVVRHMVAAAEDAAHLPFNSLQRRRDKSSTGASLLAI